ncbi:MAG: hypothetical protein Q9M29_00415 [Mariprofundaceae bacterium]|nr:hypothetical protein [Mariprofundaceae bacterium]
MALAIWPWQAGADCVGEYRDTTPEEKAAWDRVLRETPRLIPSPAGYVPKKSEISVSREGRCDNEVAPIYLPLYVRFVLDDEHQQSLRKEVTAIDRDIQAVYQRFMPRQMALQQEMMAIKPVFPPTPEYEAKQRAFEEKIEALERDRKRELAPLERKRDRLMARQETRVSAFFNSGSAGCRGDPVDVAGAVAACMRTGDDGQADLTVLFGPWRKDGEGNGWRVKPAAVPAHALRSLEVIVSGAREAVDAIRRGTDWPAVQALLDVRRAAR